jgi:hypothetical protein
VHVFTLRRGFEFGAVHRLLCRPALLILGVRRQGVTPRHSRLGERSG